jgi:hypothetical protein
MTDVSDCDHLAKVTSSQAGLPFLDEPSHTLVVGDEDAETCCSCFEPARIVADDGVAAVRINLGAAEVDLQEVP